jgi:hypothetical protein
MRTTDVLPTTLVINLVCYEIVGKRSDDALPCFSCDQVGPILILRVNNEIRDICPTCLGRLWL